MTKEINTNELFYEKATAVVINSTTEVFAIQVREGGILKGGVIALFSWRNSSFDFVSAATLYVVENTARIMSECLDRNSDALDCANYGERNPKGYAAHGLPTPEQVFLAVARAKGSAHVALPEEVAAAQAALLAK